MADKQINLKEKYTSEVVPVLMREFGIKNPNACPAIKKIVVNMGIGDAVKNKELINTAKQDLATITGQVPSVRAAKLSVASFSVRKGMPIGLKVTLRRDKMYNFLEKLTSIVLPRLRDFRGVPLKSFDKQGNYSLGMEEHIVFPEIDMTKTSPRGMEITIVTNAGDKEKSKRLLELMGMPFEKEE